MFIGKHLESLFAVRPTGGKRRYKCKYCLFGSPDKQKMGHHYDTVHSNLIPGDMDGYRYFYYLLSGKNKGSCVICSGETVFNRATMKYARFCKKEECKKKYREQFKERMIGKYGKIHLLDDPDIQKKMLAARKISGEYQWDDGVHKFSYTGSYELDFLKYLNLTLKWKVDDIMSPSPHVYEYEYDGTAHFYIPDFFIPSLGLEIEIKDDGSAKNINPASRAKDKIKEELMKSNSSYFKFIKIINKEYSDFEKLIKEDAS